jgi:hypothetical protein
MRVACEPRVDVVLQRHLAPGQKGQRGGEQPAVLADLTLTVAWQTFFQAYMAGPIVLVFWIGGYIWKVRLHLSRVSPHHTDACAALAARDAEARARHRPRHRPEGVGQRGEAERVARRVPRAAVVEAHVYLPLFRMRGQASHICCALVRYHND